MKRSVVNRFTPLTLIGTALQLFGVQFVNILLICLTLGIWIPWARVRKRRFFYSNTRILDEGLDYFASGFDIFKGWLIVTLVLALFYAVPLLGVPFLQEGFSLALVLVYPWAINRSLRASTPATSPGVMSGLISTAATSPRSGISSCCRSSVS